MSTILLAISAVLVLVAISYNLYILYVAEPKEEEPKIIDEPKDDPDKETEDPVIDTFKNRKKQQMRRRVRPARAIAPYTPSSVGVPL